jgi:hypothetical protein
MLSILFYFLIVTIICAAVYYILGIVPLPGPFLRVAQIVVIVIWLIIILYLAFALLPGLPSMPMRR